MNTADFMKQLFTGEGPKPNTLYWETPATPVQPGKFCSAHGRNAVVMYSGTDCPYCKALEDLTLANINLQISKHELEALANQGHPYSREDTEEVGL